MFLRMVHHQLNIKHPVKQKVIKIFSYPFVVLRSLIGIG